MICAASKLELELMSDNSVRITLRCDSAYEASVLFHDVDEACKSGGIELEFDIKKRTIEV